MTEQELLHKIHLGTMVQASHPCVACRAGLSFAEFPHFHGSDFGKCVRQVQYDKIMKPDPITDPGTMQFLLDGHLHEEAIVKAIRSSGVKVDHRMDATAGVMTDEFIVGYVEGGTVRKVYPDLKTVRQKMTEDEIVIIGHTDGVIEDRFLLECKSVKDWAAKNKFKGGRVPDNYYGQMQCYINCLELDGGFLVVKLRHTSEILNPMFVERSVTFFRRKLEALSAIIPYINKGEWHPCTAKSSEEKRYCDACKTLGK